MTDKLKTAFDSIRAEDGLKSSTVLYLQNEMQKQNRTRNDSVKRFAAAFASAAVIFLLGIFSYSLYLSPTAYIDLDVNPSIELTLNRFDRVIGVYTYNGDGEDIILEQSLKNKNYKDALISLIDAINQKGYIRDDGLVSVTLQTNNIDKENKMLADIQTGVAGFVAGHHNTAQIDVFSVSADTRSRACELNVSPAKYLAIEELMEVDPYITVESCKGHSVGEIRRMTREHMGDHHGGNHTHDDIDDTNGGYGNQYRGGWNHSTQDTNGCSRVDNSCSHHGGVHY